MLDLLPVCTFVALFSLWFKSSFITLVYGTFFNTCFKTETETTTKHQKGVDESDCFCDVRIYPLLEETISNLLLLIPSRPNYWGFC